MKSEGLTGEVNTKHEVVDRQQRIHALHSFFNDKFALLETTSRKLKLPNSLRDIPAPWAGKTYSGLDKELVKRIENAEVEVFVVEEVENADEIRDLFIRLQAGTALSRQQIRDAWPGNIGPYIESLAGKLDRQPAVRLFQLADKRGMRPDDDRDKQEPDRQFCAQLLTIFLARERDPNVIQGVGANDLDGLYHEQTELDVHGPTTDRFKDVLNQATKVLERARKLQTQSSGRGQKKFRKMDILALFHLLQDLSHNQSFKLSVDAVSKLANCVLEERVEQRTGRSTSGTAIRSHYDQWRKGVPDAIGIRLDKKRLFDDKQKKTLYETASGKCGICGRAVEEGDEEYDHFPTPYHAGGRTTVENGRLVHQACHPRGRIAND